MHFDGSNHLNGAPPWPHTVPKHNVHALQFQGYGSSVATPLSMGAHASVTELSPPLIRGRKARMNVVPMCTALLVPFCSFALLLFTLTFTERPSQPLLPPFVVFITGVVLFAAALGTFSTRFSKGQLLPAAEREPNWWCFMLISLTLAWILGISMGSWNYSAHMRIYQDYETMSTYKSVYPETLKGQQVMDAGILSFAEGTYLDLTRSMGFRHKSMYCIAPIVRGNNTMASYDYWAVGVDCCSGVRADYHCGAFNNPHASSAIRLVDDEARAYYRLAVQQAEAMYNIRAEHPLFFHWTADASQSVLETYGKGKQYFFVGIFAYFLFQAFLVAAASVVFAKLGRQ